MITSAAHAAGQNSHALDPSHFSSLFSPVTSLSRSQRRSQFADRGSWSLSSRQSPCQIRHDFGKSAEESENQRLTMLYE